MKHARPTTPSVSIPARRAGTLAAALGAALLTGACDEGGQADAPTLQLQALGEELAPMPNGAGAAQSATVSGAVDTTNPFFASLGTNGRACVTCHQSAEGWTITPAGVRARFDASNGLDPLFRPHDAANAPGLDVSTVEARRRAYSLMLERAVVRVGLPVRATAEFELLAADDPYGHASAAQLSLFRRPLPISNVGFATTVNWDGRNTLAADPANLRQSLKNQSNGATVGHAQAAAPIDDATREAIVDFQIGLFSAQLFHHQAKDLTAAGGLGGPEALRRQPFAYGANDPFGAGFSPEAFSLYGAWRSLSGGGTSGERRKVAEGEAVFNLKRFVVSTATGSFEATCSSCHSLPNVGGHSTFRLFDIGVSAPERRRAEVPLYTFRHKVTGETIQTTDPGRALISGLWADMNRFKVPALRGLAARAPYFHDGSATSIGEVVDFYERRFQIGFSEGEKQKLVRFLESL